MSGFIDITGNDYHFLHVLGFSHIDERRKSYWTCKCNRCGQIVVLRRDHFVYKYSKQKSCGCLRDDLSSIRMTERNKIRWKMKGATDERE